jgi:hypothetical protein
MSTYLANVKYIYPKSNPLIVTYINPQAGTNRRFCHYDDARIPVMVVDLNSSAGSGVLVEASLYQTQRPSAGNHDPPSYAELLRVTSQLVHEKRDRREMREEKLEEMVDSILDEELNVDAMTGKMEVVEAVRDRIRRFLVEESKEESKGYEMEAERLVKPWVERCGRFSRP